MNVFVLFGTVVAAVIVGNGLFAYICTFGEGGNLLVKVIANVQKRTPKTYYTGSPSGSFWPSDLWKTGWAGVLGALLGGVLTALQAIQSQVNPESYWGVAIGALLSAAVVGIQRWLTNNPR